MISTRGISKKPIILFFPKNRQTGAPVFKIKEKFKPFLYHSMKRFVDVSQKLYREGIEKFQDKNYVQDVDWEVFSSSFA